MNNSEDEAILELSSKARKLLTELGFYENMYPDSTYGIFIGDDDMHRLVIKNKDNMKESKFNTLIQGDIVSALNEMDSKLLSYSVNMHYYIELTDLGRKIAKNLSDQNSCYI